MAAWSGSLLGLTLAAMGFSIIGREVFLKWLGAQRLTSWFGPFDAPGALSEMQAGLIQAAVVLGVTLFLVLELAGRRPTCAAVMALALTAADLVLANARMVVTVPQSLLDSTPEAASAIARAERENPSAGPFRVHRVPIWSPIHWSESASSSRVGDFVGWANRTLEPKYGINHGVEYTLTLGAAELPDYTAFLRAGSVPGPGRGRLDSSAWASGRISSPTLGVPSICGTRATSSSPIPSAGTTPPEASPPSSTGPNGSTPPPAPSKGPGARPARTPGPGNTTIRSAGISTHSLGPGSSTTRGPSPPSGPRAGRAWPGRGTRSSSRTTSPGPNRPGPVYDPRRYVWLEDSARPGLADYLTGGYPSNTEAVRVVRHEPDRVELEATLDRPGIVVLSDVDYPGWTLAIDGQPAPIYRANLMMRGAAVSSGRHTLVYQFRPDSFRLGLVVSCLGLAGLGLLLVSSRWAESSGQSTDPGHPDAEL